MLTAADEEAKKEEANRQWNAMLERRLADLASESEEDEMEKEAKKEETNRQWNAILEKRQADLHVASESEEDEDEEDEEDEENALSLQQIQQEIKTKICSKVVIMSIVIFIKWTASERVVLL